MSALVFAAITKWLFPVRREGESVVHFVPRNGQFLFDHDARALCGIRGKLDAYARPRWKNGRASSARICQECHAASCVTTKQHVFRVSWS